MIFPGFKVSASDFIGQKWKYVNFIIDSNLYLVVHLSINISFGFLHSLFAYRMGIKYLIFRKFIK